MPEINSSQIAMIDDFVDKLVAEKGLGDLEIAEQVALKVDLSAQVEARVERAMLKALGEEKLVELEGLVERGVSDEELDVFLGNSGVDFAPVVQRAMGEFREVYLGNEAREI